MGGIGSKVCDGIASCANAFDSLLPVQNPHDGGAMREKVKKDNTTLVAENKALLVRPRPKDKVLLCRECVLNDE
jgi:hypothetical protein